MEPEFQMGLRLVLANCRHSPRSLNDSMQPRFVQLCILVCFRSCSYVITERIRKKKSNYGTKFAGVPWKEAGEFVLSAYGVATGQFVPATGAWR
jgi:hypothetical protein